MSRETLFYAQDTHEFRTPWFHFLSAGARVAWMYLKGYAKDNSRQRSPGKCQRLDAQMAAYTWRVTEAEFAEMEAAALKSGELEIAGEFWVVTDKATFVNERTLQRESKATLADTAPEIAPEEPSAAECPTLGGTGGNSCHATETETGTDVQPTVEEGERAREFEPGDGAAYWDRNTTAEPMRSVALCLCRVSEKLGQPPPEPRKVARFVGEGQGCRQAVDRVGWSRAADAYVLAVTTSSVTSWTTVNDSLDAWLHRLDNGIREVPRTRAALPARETAGQKSVRIKTETLDQMLRDGDITRAQYDAKKKELDAVAA